MHSNKDPAQPQKLIKKKKDDQVYLKNNNNLKSQY